MLYYPVFLDIKGRPCLVVGGGEVAERKALSLLSAGAKVTIAAPRVTKKLKELAGKGTIEFKKGPYRAGGVKGFFLVIAATDSNEVNEAVYREAQSEKALVNVVDDPKHCGFIMPSVVDRGALLIAISTSGKSPILARTLREELESCIGREYEYFIEILGSVRKKLLKTGLSHDKKERIIKDLVHSPIPELLKSGDSRGVNEVLKKALGQGWTLSKLGMSLKGGKLR